MSVLCCHISDFLLKLHTLHNPSWAGEPLALLDEDERVLAVSPEASACGIVKQLSATQAQMRCPDVRLHPIDSVQSNAEQEGFLSILRALELPVEVLDWGAAYVDLHTVTNRRSDVMPIGQELGRQLRLQMGASLQPALGWDSGKFTAQVAARSTRPGHIKLVDKSEEKRFLRPLPVTLLPLDPRSLQLLCWLGIRTLGDFAALPESAVWQRFGQAGKLAWRWAQGKDNRPVQASGSAEHPPLTIEFFPPEGLLTPVENAFTATVRPTLHNLRNSMQAVRRLRLQLCFADSSQRSVDLAFVDGIDEDARLVQAVKGQLSTLIWPDALCQMQIYLVEISERPMQQQTLFPALLEVETSLDPVASRLSGRYGSVCYRATVADLNHPAAERRSHFLSLSPQ